MEAYVRLPINRIYPSNKWALMLVYQTLVLLRNFNSIPKIINRILDDGEIYQGESIVFKFFVILDSNLSKFMEKLYYN